MALSTFSVRMDENLKNEFEDLCKDFGMNVNTAFNVFARAVVREQRIPFDICASDKEDARKDFRQAFYALRDEAKANGLQGMTLDEINEEIRLAREEREKREAKDGECPVTQ